MFNQADILQQLGIDELNAGAYSGHIFKSSLAEKKLISLNPSTNRVIASVSTCTDEDYACALSHAKDAKVSWREWPAPKRGEIIRQIGLILRQYKTVLGSLVSLEMGKSLEEGMGEVQEMIDIADYAVGLSRMLYGRTMHSERKYHRLYEQWHPYGVIGVITAFNFPVAVWAWNAFIAAVCGNVILWKPSSEVPLCAIAVHLLCARVLKENDAPAIFNLFIPGSHDVVTRMLMDSQIPVISFTGSTPVGKKVAAAVASRLGRTILELGGNNAIIVTESADFAQAIPSIVFGALGTSGQRCTSTRRIFVHQTRYNALINSLLKAYKQIKIGSALDKNNLMGPLVNEAAVKGFIAAIKRLKALGATVIFGGNVIEGDGFFVEPTLVTEVKNHWDIVQEETFAPILYIIPYTDFKEAIVLQNAVTQGLSSAVFTQKLKEAEQFVSEFGSDCGIANINIGTSGAEIGGAFGGEKETGGGREAGSDAWKGYMWRQTNTINWGEDVPLSQGIHFEW